MWFPDCQWMIPIASVKSPEGEYCFYWVTGILLSQVCVLNPNIILEKIKNVWTFPSNLLKVYFPLGWCMTLYIPCVWKIDLLLFILTLKHVNLGLLILLQNSWLLGVYKLGKRMNLLFYILHYIFGMFTNVYSITQITSPPQKKKKISVVFFASILLPLVFQTRFKSKTWALTLHQTDRDSKWTSLDTKGTIPIHPFWYQCLENETWSTMNLSGVNDQTRSKLGKRLAATTSWS